MHNNIVSVSQFPEDIRREFSVDEPGKAYASQSAIARSSGVKQPSVQLEKINEI